MAYFNRKDFLEALFQNYFREKAGFIVVKTVKLSEKRAAVRYFPNIEILAKEVYPPDVQVFFGVCPHENMRPEQDSIKFIPALWAGLDLGPEGYSGKQVYFFGQPQAAKAVRSFPLPPSIIVESGRGLHLYWLLSELTPAADMAEIEILLDKINHYFQCRTPVGINSLMRLPGTKNGKPSSHNAECRVKYVNGDFRYSLDDFRKLSLGSGVQTATGPVIAPAGDSPDEIATAQAEALTPLRDENEDGPAADNDDDDFEPVPYEILDETHAGLQVEELSDRVAEKVMQRLRDEFMGELVDRIVEKLTKRISGK
jgi:hypothetical protein